MQLAASQRLDSEVSPLVPTSCPRRIRATSLSIVFGLGVAVFGGTAQVVATWLISATGSHIAPAWYLTVATLISTIPLLWLTETVDKMLVESG